MPRRALLPARASRVVGEGRPLVASSSSAARSVTALALAIDAGSVSNGFACVRPPGHHAHCAGVGGFCLFNNVAVAARALQARVSRQVSFNADDARQKGQTTRDAYSDRRLGRASRRRVCWFEIPWLSRDS